MPNAHKGDSAQDESADPAVPLTPERLATMTVDDVWRHFEQQEGAFRSLVRGTAERFAAQHGYAMPDQPTFRRVLEEGRDQPFGATVELAVMASRKYPPVPADDLAAYNASRSCRDKRSVCHAPSTSMYFGRDGNVSVCCYSRANKIGRYPEDSIQSLWTGERIQSLRDHLRNNILPFGCEKCADQLAARNYTGLLAASFDGYAPAPENGTISRIKKLFGQGETELFPAYMEFELSNKCNLECTMCSGFCSSSIRANRENLPALPQLYDAAFVEQLKPFIPHLKEARFFGGEPFLIDLYYEIWELFMETNPSCEIFITSNGTVFTPKVQRVLERLNCRVTVSLDSVHKESYERIRRNATLEHTLANIEKFREINHRRGKWMSLNVCPMVTNWRELPDIVDYANTHDLSIFFTTVTYPENASLKFLPAAEQSRISEFLKQAIRPPAGKVQTGNFKALRDLSRQVEAWTMDSQTSESPVFAIL